MTEAVNAKNSLSQQYPEDRDIDKVGQFILSELEGRIFEIGLARDKKKRSDYLFKYPRSNETRQTFQLIKFNSKSSLSKLTYQKIQKEIRKNPAYLSQQMILINEKDILVTSKVSW